jgi:hypothetical protein
MDPNAETHLDALLKTLANNVTELKLRLEAAEHVLFKDTDFKDSYHRALQQMRADRRRTHVDLALEAYINSKSK